MGTVAAVVVQERDSDLLSFPDGGNPVIDRPQPNPNPRLSSIAAAPKLHSSLSHPACVALSPAAADQKQDGRPPKSLDWWKRWAGWWFAAYYYTTVPCQQPSNSGSPTRFFCLHGSSLFRSKCIHIVLKGQQQFCVSKKRTPSTNSEWKRLVLLLA